MKWSSYVFCARGFQRDLHSFPTRRSSDLGPFYVAGRWGPQIVEAAEVDLRDPEQAAIFRASTQDRKSTRLNSSHLGISYAVFCSKKKNTTKKQSTEQPVTSYSTLGCTVVP